ncbi:cytidylate kinase [Lachnospiraceae bacterium PFB1-21]
MRENVIIAIGRQFGSGGHEIGTKLADRLGIPFFDKKLVNMAAEQLEISNITAATLDEKALDYFLATYNATEEGLSDESELPLSEQMYLAQSNIILSLANKSSCVVVGRCADYILRENENCINVFVHAEDEDKTKRIAEIFQISDKKARDKIKKVDAERKYYYESHTGRAWGSIDSHQILFNSSLLAIEDIIDILTTMYEMK